MYRVTAGDGEIKIFQEQYGWQSNNKTYSIFTPDGEMLKRIQKSKLDSVDTLFREDMIKINPYVIWTFYPENAKNLLLIRVRGEIQKRIDYFNTIKHLVWNK